ncbi:Cullin-2 [Dirofilaria immitis]|nr:Cullin-2 [Dirofilaria immitis]
MQPTEILFLDWVVCDYSRDCIDGQHTEVRGDSPFVSYPLSITHPLCVMLAMISIGNGTASVLLYSLRPKQVDFDATWESIENSIKRVMKLQPLERRVWDYNFNLVFLHIWSNDRHREIRKYQKEDIKMSDIYSLCVAIPEPLSERLYGKTKECLEGHVTELYQEINAANDSELLSIYCQLWNVYYKGALCVHNLFGYLNKQYIKIKRCTEIEGGYGAYSQYLTQKDVKEIGLLAMEIWRKKLIDPIEKRLVGHVLNAIAADREGKNSVSVDIVRDAIMSFVQVDDVDGMHEVLDKSSSNLPQNYETYREIFERRFLQTTTEYYTVLSIKLLSELSCSQYMESVIARIEEENERSLRFLHKSSHEKVTKLCQDVMVDAHKERLYAVCHEYIEGECMSDLRNMYRILKPINAGLSVVIREFQNFVKKTGLEALRGMRGDNIPQQFVENVLQRYQFAALSMYDDVQS